MSEPQVPRDEEMLGEIAELELALAKEAFARARESETPDDFETYSRAFQRLGRACRLSLALRDKFLRMRRQPRHDAQPAPVRRDGDRIILRVLSLRAAVRRVIWREREQEHPDTDNIWRLLDHDLDVYLPDDWGQQPLDDHVVEVCADYGLSLDLARNWRDLPPPPDGWEPPPEADDDETEDALEDRREFEPADTG